VEIGGSAGQDMRWTTPIKPKYDPTYAGFLGSFTSNTAPDYVVIADNLNDTLVIKKHSKSAHLEDDEIYLKRLNAKRLMLDSPIFIAIFSAKPVDDNMDLPLLRPGIRGVPHGSQGWVILEKDKNTFLLDFSHEKSEEYLRDYFIISRSSTFFDDDNTPPKEYTDYFKKQLVEFECALSPEEVIKYVRMYEPTDPKYTLAGACFYSYANSISGAALSALTVGSITSVFATPAAGVLAGLTALSAHDIVFRFLVVKWAFENGHNNFAVANLVYIVINILFASVSAFKALKLTEVGGLISGMSSGLPRLAQIIKISPVGTTLVAVLDFLVEVVISVGTYFYADYMGKVDRKKVLEYLKNDDKLDQDVKSSLVKIMEEVKNQYPSR
jgi:hypothetical protein